MTEELLGQNNLQSEGVEPTPNEPQAATPESTLPTTDVTPDAVEPSDDEGIGASEMDADLESADEGSGEMTQDEDKSKAESDKRRKSGYKRGEIFETTSKCEISLEKAIELGVKAGEQTKKKAQKLLQKIV